jgi:hypothetical protein
MSSHIVVNKLGLTYKSTVGLSTATLPDVCKTPSPGGPVPIPYPNFADQSSLDKGTTTVKAKGKMIAIKGSEYSRSNGDEAGTAGGVASSTNMKETGWITYSFDVKMDGQNACRHTDKKFHNHKNTVDLAGNVDPSAATALLEDFFCKCLDTTKPKRDSTCRSYGDDVQGCVEQKIKEHNDAGGEPKLQGEKGYRTNGAKIRGEPTRQDYFRAHGKKGMKGTVWPDAAMVGDDGKPQQFYEFKTKCPEGVRTRRKKKGGRYWTYCTGEQPTPTWSKGQEWQTKALGENLNPPIDRHENPPILINNDNCK